MYLSIPKKFFVPISYIEKETLDIGEIVLLNDIDSNIDFKEQINIVQREFIDIMKKNIYRNYNNN